MNEIIHVTPAAGLVVRDPETMAALPPEGKAVAAGPHWLRRAAAGDVVIAPVEAARTKKAKE